MMAPITSTYEEGSVVKTTKGKSFQIFLDKNCTTKVCIEKKMGKVILDDYILAHFLLCFFDDSCVCTFFFDRESIFLVVCISVYGRNRIEFTLKFIN